MPNFVDHEFFKPDDKKPPLRPFLFLTVAHLVKSKNMGALLHAFQHLLKQDEEIKLRIAGDGPERRTLGCSLQADWRSLTTLNS